MVEVIKLQEFNSATDNEIELKLFRIAFIL